MSYYIIRILVFLLYFERQPVLWNQGPDVICGGVENIVDAECRVFGALPPRYFPGPGLYGDYCDERGFVCANRRVPTGSCLDYEVRFLCRRKDSIYL